MEKPRYEASMMGTILNISFVLVSCALFGGVGCGKSVPPGAAPQQSSSSASSPVQVDEKTAADGGSAVETPVEVEYAYRAEGRRDPFESLVKGTEVATPAPKEEGPFVAVLEGGNFSPLERYDLEELRLVGIVDGGGAYRGLVEVADGKSYFLGSGARVGRNGGVVSRVLEDRVVITETYRNPLGETRTKDVYLTFTKTGGD